MLRFRRVFGGKEPTRTSLAAGASKLQIGTAKANTEESAKLCLKSHPATARRSIPSGCGMEGAMNTSNSDLRNLTVQTHSGLRWSDIKRQLTDWRQLEGLDDRCLQDIGISRGQIASVPFWSGH
jgi:uncharacterized protein YjiS (DUF1127 family)